MTDALSPTGRAPLVLELLQSQPGVGAAELAARLGVTERAVRRYIAILREADIPIESTRGPYGGSRVGRGVRLAPLMFTASEALGLVMAVLDGNHVAADVDEPVGSALGKLIRALPENVGRPADTVRRHAAASVDRRATRPDLATTGAPARARRRRAAGRTPPRGRLGVRGRGGVRRPQGRGGAVGPLADGPPRGGRRG